ncbi:alcohol dehydrogenase catalytic domain-containing protein [Lentibacillus sp. N15]|uniref:alcohol dehydrogenase catalytic domain-containing protein n=1 Tax=Lentibacillus songyuanensis TaxID=3136161 RepID=UPI0031BAC0B5
MKEKNIIDSRAFQLVAPGEFEEITLQHTVKDNEVVVQPIMASICHADLRYYTGQRRKEALERKLPMALLHEGIGLVIESEDKSFEEGQRVVIIPNIPERRLKDRIEVANDSFNKRNVADNYSQGSVFLGSGYDGIGQEHLVLPVENVIPIPDDVPNEIAVLTELTSVSLHAISHVSDCINEGKVAVFGDGPVGYLTAAALHHVYDIPKDNLLVFGAIKEKLEHFDFATTHLVQDYNFRAEKDVVVVIECTGGHFSENAINQAINLIEPQGKITLMGVSEERVPLNTRDVLEKGLTMYGTSRSTAKDFQTFMKALQNNDYQRTLRKILPNQHEVIRNVNDLREAMEETIENKSWKKTVLRFDW